MDRNSRERTQAHFSAAPISDPRQQTGGYVQHGNRNGMNTNGYPAVSENTGRTTGGAPTGGYPQQGTAKETGNGYNPNLRSWQQDVWTGPVPSADNPFDEPDDAPELLSERSDNLNDRQNEFWKKQTSGYQVARDQQNNPAPVREKPDRKAGKKVRLIAVLGAVAIIAVIAIVLRFTVFSVQTIRVIGNSRIGTEDIIRLSGIRRGDFILSVSDDSVSRGLGRNCYLTLKYVDKELPGCVTICVKEREACCWMNYCGILYAMDKSGVILEEEENPNVIPPQNLVKVTGLSIRSECRTGLTLVLDTREQELVFHELFLEMKVLGCTSLVAEADLANPNSILLTMRNGYTVAMGNSSNIHAKLRALLLTMDKIAELEATAGTVYKGGTINVATPESPIFSPEI